MSTESHRSVSDSFGRDVDVVAGAVGGVVAGVIGGIVLQLVGAAHVLTEAVPALVGIPGPAPLTGWLLFVLVSLVLGLLYAALVAGTGRDLGRPTRGALAGAVYGVALWLLIAVAIVPLATAAAGYADAPAFPYVDPVALAGYVVFGAAIGVLHAAVTGYRFADAADGDVAA